MFQDLCAHHELTSRRGLFQEQVGKVHLNRFGLAGLLRQFSQGKTTKFPVFSLQAQIAVDHRAHLRCVHPQVNARRAQLQRFDLRPDRHQVCSKAVFGFGNDAVQHVEDFRRVQHVSLGMLGQRICRRHQIVRIGQIRRE